MQWRISSSLAANLVFALLLMANLGACLPAEHGDQVLKLRRCESLIDIVGHDRFGGMLHAAKFVLGKQVKLTLHIEDVDGERVLVLGDTFNDFAAAHSDLDWNESGWCRAAAGKRILDLRQRKLRSNARQVRSNQSALAANHMARRAAALALIDVHAVLNISWNIVIGGGASDVANIRDNAPDIRIGKPRSRHSGPRYAVVDGIEDRGFAQPEIAPNCAESRRPIALGAIAPMAGGAGFVIQRVS